MKSRRLLPPKLRRAAVSTAIAAVAGPIALVGGPVDSAFAASPLTPGNLLVSTSTYQGDPGIVAGTTQLPPGCTGTNCVTAVTGGAYPQVFNNDTVDSSFGVTAPITLEELTTSGAVVSARTVPVGGGGNDGMVTSFSSKSEMALNLATDGSAVTFMGYDAAPDAVDVSNTNTPGDVDPTNPDPGSNYRVVGQLNADGSYFFTETNAYSGNNGRAAILDPATNAIYTAGNAGNGGNPEPQGVVVGSGAQVLTPSTLPESGQTPGQPTPVGNFNVTELGDPADKSAKDDNYRGLALNDNVLYYTKGSGGNGVDTVYFVDPSGKACPSGTGIPATNSQLPAGGGLSYSTSDSALGLKTTNPGLTPTNMCILNGFPTALAKTATDANMYPFGLWFANPDTLYLADEGAGDNTYSATTSTYSAAAASTTAGLQKWVFDSATGQWNLAYTLQSGLGLGQPYTVAGYPTGTNSGPGGTGLPWAPATDGLRNLTGQVNADGTVTIWAATSTVSGSGDQGADPNQLVSITDNLASTTLPAAESFHTVIAPANAVVVRGVSFTPGASTTPPSNLPESPWVPVLPVAAVVVGGGLVWRQRRRAVG